MKTFENTPVLCAIPKTVNVVENFLTTLFNPTKEEEDLPDFSKEEISNVLRSAIAKDLHTLASQEDINEELDVLVKAEENLKPVIKLRTKTAKKRKNYDNTVLTPEQRKYVKAANDARLMRNARAGKTLMNQERLTDMLNKELGLNKAKSVYHRIWSKND